MIARDRTEIGSDGLPGSAGGECDASVYLNNPVECGDDYFKTYTFTNTWQNFVVKFADPLLKTQNYSGMALPPVGGQGRGDDRRRGKRRARRNLRRGPPIQDAKRRKGR